MSEQEQAVETNNIETSETATETTSGSVRVSQEEFITAWESIANSKNPSVQAVADELGLVKASVQQRATKMRNPATKKVVFDKATKKPVKVDGKVQYEAIPADKIATAIPLTNMPRGGGASLDTDAGLALFNKLKAARDTAAAGVELGEDADAALSE